MEDLRYLCDHTLTNQKRTPIYSDSYNPFDNRHHSLTHDRNAFDTWFFNRYYSNDIIYANNTCGSILHDFMSNLR